jgi:hypothetical protein
MSFGDHGMRLATDDDCDALLHDLLEADPESIGDYDIALLNLICAPNLAGSKGLNVGQCLARIDQLAAFVKASTERSIDHFSADPDYGHCEPKWRMAKLVTNLKLDYGAAYDPRVVDDLRRGGESPFIDAHNVFIHGLLDDDPQRRWGSCSSIPVLVTAVARRLGYPVKLAINRKHVYARWDDGRVDFNIEASNPAGMTTPNDKHYHRDFGPRPNQKELASGLYFRALTPAEEFGVFLQMRAASLHDQARYSQTLLWSARSLQFSPTQPYFSGKAYEWAMLGIKHRFRQKYSTRQIPPPERNNEFFFHPGEFLRAEEQSLFLTIVAHYHEYLGEIYQARERYEDACRLNFHGNNEQRDLQRFLKKHGKMSRRGPPLWPKTIGEGRRMRLPACPPAEQADTLHRLADRFERDGELLRARDTLHDLYVIDPSDAAVFQRARAIERQPAFQRQLRAAIEQKRLTQQVRFGNFTPIVQLARSL